MVWLIDTNPPGRGPHTVSPIKYDEVPNFKGPDGLPRTYAFITDEAAGAADMKPCTSGIRSKSYMVDITDETHPFPVSTWQVPVGNFCDKGGRFGPHQHAEKVNSEINRFEDKLAWVAYFNAGIRVVDLSDPYNLKEVGYYIPKTNSQSHPIAKGQPTAIQINDVTIDHRGLAYASDRVGTGLFVLDTRERSRRRRRSNPIRDWGLGAGNLVPNPSSHPQSLVPVPESPSIPIPSPHPRSPVPNVQNLVIISNVAARGVCGFV